jgi:hypothetical protein
VSDAWMPGIRYVRATSDGGPLKGGAPRVVWHALEADPQTVSARSAAQRLDQREQASHLVWNPLNGEIVQLIPIVRAARSLGPLDYGSPAGGAGRAAAITATAEGRVCVQVCVVAFGREPFTAGPMTGLQQIQTWLDSWGVPRCWPAGPPAPFPDCVASVRSRRLWARGGHFGASQVPGIAATGPGPVDIERLTGWSAGHATRAATRERAPALAGANDADPSLSEFLGNHVAVAASLTRS